MGVLTLACLYACRMLNEIVLSARTNYKGLDDGRSVGMATVHKVQSVGRGLTVPFDCYHGVHLL